MTRVKELLVLVTCLVITAATTSEDRRKLCGQLTPLNNVSWDKLENTNWRTLEAVIFYNGTAVEVGKYEAPRINCHRLQVSKVEGLKLTGQESFNMSARGVRTFQIAINASDKRVASWRKLFTPSTVAGIGQMILEADFDRYLVMVNCVDTLTSASIRNPSLQEPSGREMIGMAELMVRTDLNPTSETRSPVLTGDELSQVRNRLFTSLNLTIPFTTSTFGTHC